MSAMANQVFIVAPGDVNGWEAAIRRLQGDASPRDRIGRNAHRWVEPMRPSSSDPLRF